MHCVMHYALHYVTHCVMHYALHCVLHYVMHCVMHCNAPMSQLSDVCHGSMAVEARRSEDTKRTYLVK